MRILRTILVACVVGGLMTAGYANAGIDDSIENLSPKPVGEGNAFVRPIDSYQPWYSGLAVSDLKGRKIVVALGDPVSRVLSIVRDRQDSLQVVAEVGGWFGVGGKLVTVPLASLSPGDGVLILPSTLTANKLSQQPEFEPARFELLRDAYVLGERHKLEHAKQPQQSAPDPQTASVPVPYGRKDDAPSSRPAKAATSTQGSAKPKQVEPAEPSVSQPVRPPRPELGEALH